MSSAAAVFPEPDVYRRVKLAELVEFRRGLTYKKRDEVDESRNAVLRANNIDLASGQLDLSDIRYIDESINVPADKKLKAGSVLICTASGSRSHLGKAAYIDGPADYAFGGFMGLLVPGHSLDGKYLHYFMRSEEYWQFLGKLAGGTNINNLKFRDLGELTVPLPEIDKQKRIVAVLDQAFAALDRARAQAEANLSDAAELFENSLTELFDNLSNQIGSTPLAKAVHEDCKLSYGIVQPGSEMPMGLPIVRPVDLKQRLIALDGLKRISPERASGYARTKLQGGELLLCVRGSVGELAVASEELAGGNVTRGIVPIRFDDEEVLPEFAYFQLRSRYARDQLLAKTYGAALTQINIKDLRALNFLIPTLQTQREIIHKIEHLYEKSEWLKTTARGKLRALEQLRQSLLNSAFSAALA